MSTTAIITEIIVTGFFSMIWSLIFILTALEVKLKEPLDKLLEYKDFTPLLILMLFIVCYQLGWLVNSLASAIIDVPIGEPKRRKIFKSYNCEYNEVRATFYQFASPELRTDLGLDRTVVRLARGGIINFSLIFISLVFAGGIYTNISLIFLLLSIGSSIQWYKRYKRYYERMIFSYEIIKRHQHLATKSK